MRFLGRGFLRNPHSLPRASCTKLLYQSGSVSKLTSTARSKIFAERRGFEPRKHFWRLHAFQACLFNHSSISPLRNQRYNSKSATKLLQKKHIRKKLCIFFYNCVIFLQKKLHRVLHISKKSSTFAPIFHARSRARRIYTRLKSIMRMIKTQQ